MYTFILTSLLDLSKFDFFHIHMDFCNPIRIHGMKINIYDMIYVHGSIQNSLPLACFDRSDHGYNTQ